MQDESGESSIRQNAAGGSAHRAPAPVHRPAAAPEQPFSLKTGDRVLHRVFGEGTILSIKEMGGDHLLEIHFDKVGAKRIMATFARLEKI